MIVTFGSRKQTASLKKLCWSQHMRIETDRLHALLTSESNNSNSEHNHGEDATGLRTYALEFTFSVDVLDLCLA